MIRFARCILLLALIFGAAHQAAAQTYYLPGAEPPRPAPAPPDSVVTIKVDALAKGVYAAKVNHVWTGWVELPEGILVIDTGPSARAGAMLGDTIRARSGSRPIKWVVNTHAHADHVGGNGYFAAQGASFIAQAGAAKEIDSTLAAAPTEIPGGEGAASKILKPVQGVKTSTTIGGKGAKDRKALVLYLGKPAHTASDLVVYLPVEKIVFTGDLVWNEAVPWLLDPGFSRLGWIADLDSLVSGRYKIEKLVPGHGVYAAEPWRGLKYTRSYLNDAFEKAAKEASWGTAVRAVRDWGYLGPYEASEFYQEVHFMNMRRLYNEALGKKTPGRPRAATIKK
jgi:glyoxylase-like metal-dependent hydrolase (beta-lactamase superfamily II)